MVNEGGRRDGVKEEDGEEEGREERGGVGLEGKI